MELHFIEKSAVKNSIQSKLDQIPGIGEASRLKLLRDLKTFTRIKSASENEIIDILGNKKGKKIFETLKKY